MSNQSPHNISNQTLHQSHSSHQSFHSHHHSNSWQECVIFLGFKHHEQFVHMESIVALAGLQKIKKERSRI